MVVGPVKVPPPPRACVLPPRTVQYILMRACKLLRFTTDGEAE